MKKIIACGCSWTYGGNWSVKNDAFNKFPGYADKLENLLKLEVINLARPGASNYCIAKQIEHAITLKPDLLLFNITTSQRIEFIPSEKRLSTRPTLSNFNYEEYNTNSYTEKFTGKIYSSTLRHALLKWSDKTNNENSYYITKFLDKYLNHDMLVDYSRMYILSAIRLLEKNKIPYVCVNFSDDIFEEREINDINHISMSWSILHNKFPGKDDPYHFSEEGHQYLADMVHKYMVDNNITF
jgi:hypothetical protein